jgi:Predicted metal-dependent hydrolase
MKIYDITQELFTGRVFPGDPAPSYERVLKIAKGDVVNLTNVVMGTHNATHLDAPYHFYDNGKTVEQLDLDRCIGPCTVIEVANDISEEELAKVLDRSQKRVLIKGETVVTLERAKLFNQYGILLLGVEGQSVGPVEGPMAVHLELLGKEVVLLEGLVLQEVATGDYFLSAAPIKLGGSDGAPCRATLLDFTS